MAGHFDFIKHNNVRLVSSCVQTLALCVLLEGVTFCHTSLEWRHQKMCGLVVFLLWQVQLFSVRNFYERINIKKKIKMEVITWMGVWVVWLMTVIILLSTVHTGGVWAVTGLFNHTATTTVWLNKQTNRLRHFIVELLIMYALFLMEKYIIFKLFYCSLCLRRSQCNRTMSSPQIFLGSLWSLAAK